MKTICWQCDFEMEEEIQNGQVTVCPFCLIPCAFDLVCEENHVHTKQIHYRQMGANDASLVFKKMRELFDTSRLSRMVPKHIFFSEIDRAERKSSIRIN